VPAAFKVAKLRPYGRPLVGGQRDAMKRHTDAGILVVAAAGNSAQDNDQFGNYPVELRTRQPHRGGGLEKTGRMYSGSSYGATR
jgi:hypothetical protein